MKNNNVRTASLGATAVVAGLIAVFGAAGAASAAEISGEGHVTLDFASTPGSVEVTVWTHNLSTVEAYGAAVIQDVDGQRYARGPERYAAGQEKTFVRTLAGRTCADLGRGAIAFAFGFGDLSTPTPDWIGAPLSYPDPRITVIGCDSPPVEPNPTGGEPVVTPVPGTTTPTATTPTATTNKLPAAKTDGADLAAASHTTPIFGLLVTLGAVLAASAAAAGGALRRR